MKYLSSYTEEAQTKLFEELGVFFAFSAEQLKEGIEKNRHLLKPGEKFARVGGFGMVMPKGNIKEFEKRHSELVKEAIKLDLEENGREGVLQRELGNYEIGYAFDGVDDPNFRGGIEGYGFTEEEIQKAYKYHMAHNDY